MIKTETILGEAGIGDAGELCSAVRSSKESRAALLDNNNTTGEGGGEGLEDKAKIIKRLRKLLKATRAGREIIDMYLVLDGNKETVEIIFENGSKEVDITADSGIAIIKDVVSGL